MIDFDALATQCNADCRFEQAGWHESADSVAQLMETEDFTTVLTRLAPHSRKHTLIATVAALYACRLTEERARGKKVYEALRGARRQDHVEEMEMDV